MTHIGMRIGSTNPQAVYQATSKSETPAANYQVAVLKKALDSQQDAADKLLKLLEPKGKVIDIRA